MRNTRQGVAEVAGTSLYYEITGAGPVVVFLHGNPVDLHLWDAQVAPFAAHYTVLRYDLRGFGRSAAPQPGYTHAGDLNALLEFLGIRAALLVGLSMGGGVAVNFALLYPGIARALVLADSSLGGFVWTAAVLAERASVPAVAQAQGLAAARECLLGQGIFQEAMQQAAVAQQLRELVGHYSGWHWLHGDPGRPLAPPASARLGEIGVPTLVLVGEHEVPDFQRVAETLATGIPGARKVVIPGVGHVVNLEAPERFNQVVLDFLATVVVPGHA